MPKRNPQSKRARRLLTAKQSGEAPFIAPLFRAGLILRNVWVDKTKKVSAGKQPLQLAKTIWERNQSTTDVNTKIYTAWALDLLADLIQAESAPDAARRAEAEKLYRQALAIMQPLAKTQKGYRKKTREIEGKLNATRVAGGPKQPAKGWTPAAQAMHTKLTRLLEVVDAPLADAVKQIAGLSNTQIVIDRVALKSAGVTTNTPVSFKAQGTTGQALTKLLKPHKLNWLVKHGVVFVTTQARHDETLQTRVYHGVNVRNGYFTPLIKRMQKAGPKAQWAKRDGVGGITAVVPPNTLIIRQSYQVLERIEPLFAKDLKRVAIPEFSTQFTSTGAGKLAGVDKAQRDFRRGHAAQRCGFRGLQIGRHHGCFRHHGTGQRRDPQNNPGQPPAREPRNPPDPESRIGAAWIDVGHAARRSAACDDARCCGSGLFFRDPQDRPGRSQEFPAGSRRGNNRRTVARRARLGWKPCDEQAENAAGQTDLCWSGCRFPAALRVSEQVQEALTIATTSRDRSLVWLGFPGCG